MNYFVPACFLHQSFGQISFVHRHCNQMAVLQVFEVMMTAFHLYPLSSIFLINSRAVTITSRKHSAPTALRKPQRSFSVRPIELAN